jgi:hypothetical protein
MDSTKADKGANKAMGRGTKTMICVSLAAGMLLYAVPRLEVGQGWTWPTVFAVVWIGFALLVIASHLHLWLGVDEAEARRLKRIERMRKFRMRQRIVGVKGELLRAYRKSAR